MKRTRLLEDFIEILFNSYVNRSTFKCTFCAADHMDQKAIIKHMNAKHKNKPGV